MFAIPFVLYFLNLDIDYTYVLIAYSLISLAVVFIHGRGKEIGLGWVIFFTIFFTPIVGYLMAYYSPKWKGNEINIPKPNVGSILLTLVFGILSSFYFIQINSSINDPEYFEIKHLTYITNERGVFTEDRSWYIIGLITGFVTFLGAAFYTSRSKFFRFQPTNDAAPQKKKINYTNIIVWVSIIVLMGLLLVVVIKDNF